MPRRLLLVVVPYRDRAAHLQVFLRRVWAPLHEEYPASELLIAEQAADRRPFNRGALLNCAYDYARRRGAWRVLFHDVDLVPTAAVRRAYYEARGGVVHFAHCWRDRYPGSGYFGGVVGFAPRLFERVDGFPSTFWGWGGEDDALLRRARAAGLRVTRPCGGDACAYEDLERLSLRGKLAALRAARAMCTNKRDLLQRQHAQPGLRRTRYRHRTLTPDRVRFSILACRAVGLPLPTRAPCQCAARSCR